MVSSSNRAIRSLAIACVSLALGYAFGKSMVLGGALVSGALLLALCTWLIHVNSAWSRVVVAGIYQYGAALAVLVPIMGQDLTSPLELLAVPAIIFLYATPFLFFYAFLAHSVKSKALRAVLLGASWWLFESVTSAFSLFGNYAMPIHVAYALVGIPAIGWLAPLGLATVSGLFIGLLGLLASGQRLVSVVGIALLACGAIPGVPFDATGERMRLSVVQPRVTKTVWTNAFDGTGTDRVVANLLAEARRAPSDALVVYPETAFPLRFYHRLIEPRLAGDSGLERRTLVFGGIYRWGLADYNAAFAFERGVIRPLHLKRDLAPGVETRWLRAGQLSSLLEVNRVRVAVLICKELYNREFLEAFRASDASVLLILSNVEAGEARATQLRVARWAWYSSRKPIVVASFNGSSAVFDADTPDGRVAPDGATRFDTTLKLVKPPQMSAKQKATR